MPFSVQVLEPGGHWRDTPMWFASLRDDGATNLGINVHEHGVVPLGCVLGLVLDTRRLAHHFHFVWMTPGPIDFRRQLGCLARREIQSRLPLFEDFRDGI